MVVWVLVALSGTYHRVLCSAKPHSAGTGSLDELAPVIDVLTLLFAKPVCGCQPFPDWIFLINVYKGLVVIEKTGI